MGSPANYTVSSRFIVSNIDNSNESNDEFEEQESNFNDVAEEDTSQINLSNDMDTSVMYSDHEDRDTLLPVDNDFLVLYNVNQEIDATEGSTTDSEGDADENINQEAKRIKLDNEAIENELENCDVTDKCPICLEAWTSNGKHRLCSLRCGHLFGYNCIKLWLNSDNSGTKNCPQCHAKASVRHIRFLYANKLTSLDNSEIERMKEELKEARLKASEAAKALIKEKQRTKKYKQMYQARTLALIGDSDFSFSD